MKKLGLIIAEVLFLGLVAAAAQASRSALAPTAAGKRMAVTPSRPAVSSRVPRA
jgi:hypothetical protein